jgi:hypothetical protein
VLYYAHWGGEEFYSNLRANFIRLFHFGLLDAISVSVIAWQEHPTGDFCPFSLNEPVSGDFLPICLPK